MAKVILTSLTKVYRARNGSNVTAVKDLNLEIQDREFVVLVGPPKCGISTIIRMIAGLDDISKGDILIGDRCVNNLPGKDRDVALVAQDYLPYPQMSVSDNLAMGLRKRKFSREEAKKRVIGAAEVFGLQELLEYKPDSLSGEQRQRLAIARAIALQPRVFLFDEPLSGLTKKTAGQLRSEIAKLHQRSRATMIYATHDPSDAMAIGGRIIVISDGVIQQDAPGRTLYDQPQNIMVAEFFGSPPMNLVRGALKEDREWLLFSEEEGGTIGIRLPTSKFPSARTSVGKPVLLGIRPEEIGVTTLRATEKYSGSFPAIIDFVEVTGGETNIHIQSGAHRLICRTGPGLDPGSGGQRQYFQLNTDKICLFDSISGDRIV